MLISCDPGKSGAIVCALGYEADGFISSYPMPETRGDAIQLCSSFVTVDTKPTIYIEKITGFVAGAGAGQMFQFGAQVERIGCIFETLGCRVIEVSPKVWQKHFGLGKKGHVKAERRATDEEKKKVRSQNARLKTEWKNKLKAEAQRRFPGIVVTLANADALLILDYARAMEKGLPSCLE